MAEASEVEFRKELGLFDSIMIVAGVMVGSGIFIVSAEITRQVGSAGWLMVAWDIARVLTVAGALSYGELAAMMPSAGGMYVYLREAFSPLRRFLYGWTLLTVIQTGTIAAVAIAFAQDGLFFRHAGKHNRACVHGWLLGLQCLWSMLLVLPRTYDIATKTYGNLYSNLLDYVISAALLFYILTVAGLFCLRPTKPDAHRPYRCWGYPWPPALYIVGAAIVLLVLFAYRTATTWPGLMIVLTGVLVYPLLRRREGSKDGMGSFFALSILLNQCVLTPSHLPFHKRRIPRGLLSCSASGKASCGSPW